MIEVHINGKKQMVEGTKFFRELCEATGVYQSATARYTLLFDELKSRNVRFKDIREVLLKDARTAGLYVSDRDLHNAATLPMAWYRSLDLFCGWVNRHFSAYDKRKISSGGADKQIAARTKVKVGTKVISEKRLASLYASSENRKVILDFICSNLDDLVATIKANPELIRKLQDVLEAESLDMAA